MEFKADSKTSTFSYDDATLVPVKTGEHLVGRICSLVEMLGLKDAQEKSIKDEIRRAVYDLFSRENGSRFIHGNLHTAIKLLEEEERTYANKNNQPVGLIGDYQITLTVKD